MIKVEHISKTFQVARRNSGFNEAFKALFNKQYEYVKALDDISFSIDDGEMVGYIGPNGAGKSSTIKILSGILTPDCGTCDINGRTPWKNRVAHVKDIGVVFGQRSQLWWDVPVIDSFDLLRDIYSIPVRNYNSEIMLCFGIGLMEFSLAEAFARGFDTFPSTISNGEFDRIMVRPRNEILQVLGSKIEFTRIGRMLQGGVMLFYGIIKSDVTWSIDKILTVIFMIFGGTLVFTGMFVVYAALCFFTLEGLEFMNIFTDGAREFGKYPFSIYGKRLLQICTFIIPFALIQYYPLLYILDRGAKQWYMFLPILAGVFILPCYLFWKYGIRHYKSTGS